ncbi:hypothetical protein BDQ17DRAFT_1220945, partial [Cyathus striatus]
MPPGVIDSEGFAICPECGVWKNCAKGGIRNLTENHVGSEACVAAKAKKKDGSLLSFFSKPKAKLVPTTVTGPTIIANLPLPPSIEEPHALAPRVHCLVEQHVDINTVETVDFLKKFFNAITSLPNSIKEATEDDALALFAQNPANHDDPRITSDMLWEEKLNGLLKSVIGWGVDDDIDHLIWWGKMGLDGLASFVQYFI